MFKIGDKVHCNKYNDNGIVISINSTLFDQYPVVIGFEDGTIDYYTNEGNITIDTVPTLKLIEETSSGDTRVG